VKALEFRTAAKTAPRSAKAQPFFHLEKLRSRSHSARVRKHESIDGFVRLEIPFAFCPSVKLSAHLASTLELALVVLAAGSAQSIIIGRCDGPGGR
jgi:hypothetical protein